MGQALAVMHVGEFSCSAMSGIFIPVWESTPGKLAGKRARRSAPAENSIKIFVQNVCIIS